MREPTQVFTLLETVYSSFDAIAKRRRIFKIETIGDCCKFIIELRIRSLVVLKLTRVS